MKLITLIFIIVIFISLSVFCFKHYLYCEKIEYLESKGYIMHKHTIGYDGKYILYFTKGIIKIDEEEILKSSLKELKEKYK